MWRWISRIILRNRIPIFVIVALFIATMAYLGRGVEMDYGYAAGKVIPQSHPDYIYYQQFKKQFGDDGKVMFIGFQSKNLEKLEGVQAVYDISEKIKKVKGVERLLSMTHIYALRPDAQGKLGVRPLLEQRPSTMAQADTFLTQLNQLIFYRGLIYNPETKVSIIAVTINKATLDSKDRLRITTEIKAISDKHINTLGEIHYSGLPYIRSAMVGKVSKELTKFLILSILITIVILFLFFRWVQIIPVSLLMTSLGVVFSYGLMGILGYKISLLTALVPTLVMVIGIPNTIYFVTKYIELYRKNTNKVRSVRYVVEHIGAITMMNNLVTSLGFLSLSFTKVDALRQFGFVAGISIVVTYFLCLVLIPTFLLIIPAPKTAQFRHLDNKLLNGFVAFIERSVRKKRWVIYGVAICLVGICAYGMTFLKANSYMLDDIPQKDVLQKDLKFFEKNLNGVMPLEIVIDTKKPNGLLSLSVLRKLEKLEDSLYEVHKVYLSRPLSMTEVLKFATQEVFYGGDTAGYVLPSAAQYRNMVPIIQKGKDSLPILSTLVDKELKSTRLTFQMKDVGSRELTTLLPKIKKDVHNTMDSTNYSVNLTGSTVMFSWSNHYLVNNLIESIVIAFVLIAILMGILFFNVKMVFISLLPNILPLAMTAGIMGFTQVPLKPSTTIIFSITFGMTIDNAIRFLSRYRVERKKHKLPVAEATYKAIYESGISEIYTSIILLFGFGIFMLSQFGGTQALGMLVALCLAIAMFSNLFVLPSLTISIAGERDKGDGFIELPDENEEDAEETEEDKTKSI